MNLPNKLTIARVIMVPFFVFFLTADFVPLNSLWALVVFIAASITDLIDGKIARSRNLITDFGKFLDPLADKILVISALICMVEQGWTYAFFVVIIVAREFLVSAVRMIAAGSSEKIVIAAGIWGKLKTAFTMGTIVLSIVMQIMLQLTVNDAFNITAGDAEAAVFVITNAFVGISCLLTVISGCQYLWSYRHLIDSSK